MSKYTHISKPSWLHVIKGTQTFAGKSHTYMRIDHVQVALSGRAPFSVNGSLVTLCRNQKRTRYTVCGSTIIDGHDPLWLVRQNGLGALLDQPRPKAMAAGAA